MSPPPDESAITQWVALLDAAETAMRTASPHDRTAMGRIGQQLDQLVAHEHTLASSDRALAREWVWLRDHPHIPLPNEVQRASWARCLCRDCAHNRAVAYAAAFTSHSQATAWESQLAAVRRRATRKGH